MSQLEVLESFAYHGRPATATQLIGQTGLPRSTVFRTLKLLAADDFVYQDRNRRYMLGPRMLQLGVVARLQLGASELVANPLLTLGERARETVTFSVLDLPSRICTFVLESASDLRQVLQVGARYPLYLGAAGKVILAYLQEPVIDAILDGSQLNSEAIAVLRSELAEIRRLGWTTTGNERVVGAGAIAAPVFIDGEVYGSVAVVGPRDRMQNAVDMHRPQVRSTAETITRQLSLRDRDVGNIVVRA